MHPNACIAAAASDAGCDPGKRVPTSVSVTQASGVWPNCCSDWPSLNSASAAFGPSGAPENASR